MSGHGINFEAAFATNLVLQIAVTYRATEQLLQMG